MPRRSRLAEGFGVRPSRLLWAALLLGALGCERPRTQLVMRVTATPATWARVRSLRLDVRRDVAGSPPIVARCFDVDAAALERAPEFGVTPRDPDDARPLRVEVALGERACTDAAAPPALLAQAAVVTLEPERTKLLVLPFTLRCVGLACPALGCREVTCQDDARGGGACVCVERAGLADYAPPPAVDVADADAVAEALDADDVASALDADAGLDARDADDVADAGTGVEDVPAAADVALDEAHADAEAGDVREGGGGADADVASPDADAAPLPPIEEVAVGASHPCALLRGGSIRCCGSNQRFQLGDGRPGVLARSGAAPERRGRSPHGRGVRPHLRAVDGRPRAVLG